MRLAALLLLTACSKSQPAKPREFAKLSPSEVTAVCEELSAYRLETAKLPGATQVRCGHNALAAAGSPDNTTPEAMRAVCKRTLEECIAFPPPQESFDCPGFVKQTAQCGDLTVEEMRACSDEIRSHMAAIAKLDPCAGPLDPQDPLASINGWSAKMKGEKCAVIDRKCKR